MTKVEIEQITTQKELNKIRHLISAYKFKPYYFLSQLNPDVVNRLFVWQLSKIILDSSGFIFVARGVDGYMGFITLEKEFWDSSFFGFNCYKIQSIFAEGSNKIQVNIKKYLLEHSLDLCNKKKILRLSAKIDMEDRTSVYALESKRFNLLTTMLYLVWAVGCTRRHFKPLGRIRPYKPEDLESLRKIAGKSMRYDHFHSDINLPTETSNNVYISLVENCCNGVLADKVFVAERNKEAVGYVACQIHHDLNKILSLRIGNIRHLAVAYPKGFGCGPGLQEAALNWFQDKVDIVESATTIQNLPIIKISIKSNMNIVSSYLRFSKSLRLKECFL